MSLNSTNKRRTKIGSTVIDLKETGEGRPVRGLRIDGTSFQTGRPQSKADRKKMGNNPEISNRGWIENY